MDEHVHEWVLYKGVGATCKCAKTLNNQEIESRLNATERLSAEDARNCLGKLRGTVQKTSAEALRAYADTLERKHDTS